MSNNHLDENGDCTNEGYCCIECAKEVTAHLRKGASNYMNAFKIEPDDEPNELQFIEQYVRTAVLNAWNAGYARAMKDAAGERTSKPASAEQYWTQEYTP